jgi:plasmid stability protein
VVASFACPRLSGCVSVILCYAVKNITVSIPDAVYRAARIRAAEQGSSVSALVAEYLRSLYEREAEFARLESQQKRIQEQIDRFSARDRLDREELHKRAVR